MMFDRDPEEIGPEHPDDLEVRMDTMASMHVFDPDPITGRCREFLVRHGQQGARCNSTQSYSVLHIDDEADFRARHDHGGGDCMCFENDEW